MLHQGATKSVIGSIKGDDVKHQQEKKCEEELARHAIRHIDEDNNNWFNDCYGVDLEQLQSEAVTKQELINIYKNRG